MTRALAFATLLMLAGVHAAAAQPQPRPIDEQKATETREQLRQILDQYPPSVRQVLRCDPSLLTRQEYMATYPTLAAYVAQHPEVAHNTAYFIAGACGSPGYAEPQRS